MLTGQSRIMADDREPITTSEDPKSKKDKKNKGKNEARNPPPPPNVQDENDDVNQGTCSCNTAFLCSIEGALKIIEFVCIDQVISPTKQ